LGVPIDVETTFGVFDDIFCAETENIFKFLEDILDEVILFSRMSIFISRRRRSPKNTMGKNVKMQQRIKTERKLKGASSSFRAMLFSALKSISTAKTKKLSDGMKFLKAVWLRMHPL
jgi:hexosaminidase